MLDGRRSWQGNASPRCSLTGWTDDEEGANAARRSRWAAALIAAVNSF